MAHWAGEPPYPYAFPFRPKARTVTSWVLRTRTPNGSVDVPTDQATVNRLVEDGCSWFYLYAPRHGQPHTAVVITTPLEQARATRLRHVLNARHAR